MEHKRVLKATFVFNRVCSQSCNINQGGIITRKYWLESIMSENCASVIHKVGCDYITIIEIDHLFVFDSIDEGVLLEILCMYFFSLKNSISMKVF